MMLSLEIKFNNKLICISPSEINDAWDRYYIWFHQPLFPMYVRLPLVSVLRHSPSGVSRKTFRKIPTRMYLLFRYLRFRHKDTYEDKYVTSFSFFRIIHLESLAYLACLQYLYYFNDFVFFNQFRKDGQLSPFYEEEKYEIPNVVSPIFKELGFHSFVWYKHLFFYFVRTYCLVLKIYYYLGSKVPIVLTEKYITLELIPSMVTHVVLKVPFLSSRVYSLGKKKTWFSSLMKGLVFLCLWVKGTLKLVPIIVFFYYSGSSMVAGYLLSVYFFYKIFSWIGLWLIMLFQATHLSDLKSALIHSFKLPYKLTLGFLWLMGVYYLLSMFFPRYSFLTLWVVFTVRFVLNIAFREQQGKLCTLLKIII